MKQTFLVALSLFALISCKDNTAATSPETQIETEQTVANTEESDVLALNNSEKWAVNEEMKPFVMNGEALVSSYISENRTDYKELANALKEENNKLIKSCTMDGASHDELHKWLHPHLELVGNLENAADEKMGQEVVQKLSDSYVTYHQFFN